MSSITSVILCNQSADMEARMTAIATRHEIMHGAGLPNSRKSYCLQISCRLIRTAV
jgi:hypothetical protein